MWRRGTCGFAHSLGELLPPREVERLYPGVWKDGEDRWYGQHVAKQQGDRIVEYINKAKSWEVPVWAQAFRWFYLDLDIDMLPELGWDFGISQDVDALLRCRRSDRRPFDWAIREDGMRLWELLRRRRDAVEARAAALTLLGRITGR